MTVTPPPAAFPTPPRAGEAESPRTDASPEPLAEGKRRMARTAGAKTAPMPYVTKIPLISANN